MATVVARTLERLPAHTLPIFAFLSITILLYKWLYIRSHQFPSPRKLPIIGNLHQFSQLPHRSLQSLSQKYGEIMLLHLGSKPTIIISSSKLAEEIMRTHDTVFANRPETLRSRILLYNGRDILVANYGEYWRQIKSICVLHMLSKKKVQSFRNIREEEAGLMVEHIRRSAPSELINLTEIFKSFTNDVVSRVAFGRKYASEEECDIKEMLHDFSEALGAFSIGDVIPWLSWIDHVTGLLRRSTKVAKKIDEFIEKIVQEHMDRVNLVSRVDDETYNGDIDQDLVDVLLEIQKSDPSLEKDSIKALLLDMFVAGVETTATLLDWAMSELLIHPRVMQQLQDEVRRYAKGGTLINEDDLKNMTYLKAVIKETLRLHTPGPFLVREPTHDIKVGNYDISAGTVVIINVWAIQRDPALWDKPEEFRPERFVNTSVDIKDLDFDFIAFGAGRRGCPGITFASVKAELVLANLVGLFEWELPSGTQMDSFMAESNRTALHRTHPLMVIPIPHCPT